MKIFKSILAMALTAAFVVGCKEDGYIDPITAVAPGSDEEAPVVNIIYPAEGTKIRVKEDVTSINIEFEVEDDIEVESIEILLDGNGIATFSNFIDYRHAIDEFTYDELINGAHTLTVEATDLSGKTTAESVEFEKIEPYDPIYDGENFYLPFDGDFMELVSITNATEVGTPGFAGEGVPAEVPGSNAYKGAEGAYLTFPTDIIGLSNEFSASFWYKVNATPDRAGILVIGPPDEVNPDAMNNRKGGFRFFRENAGGKQRLKLNVGNGEADTWFDGGLAADIDPALGNWVHVAFTISPTECVVYFDGLVVKQGEFTGVDWTNCDILSIGSGAPRFTGWNHKSDHSFIDELRLFNKALTQQQIQQIIDDES